MEYLLETPIRFTGAALLGVAGAWSAALGLQRYGRAVALPASEPTKSLALMHAFRIAIIGLSAFGLGIAWAGEILWLAILSLVVLGEETFETTMAIGAMNYGRPQKPAPSSTQRIVRSASPSRSLH